MQSAKVVNQILVGSIAFGVSFVLGLLQHRDLNKALLVGGITGSVTGAGAAIAETRRTKQEMLLVGSLKSEIQELKAEETQLLESLYTATMTRQEVEASINALQSERSRLLTRISELHKQRNLVYQEIVEVQKQKQQLQEEFSHLQAQIQQFEKHQAELSQSLSAKIFQIQQTETRLNRLRKEHEQLQNQRSDKANPEETLNEDIALLESRKQHLGGEVYDLDTQLKVLEQRQEELNQTLLSLQIQKQKINTDLKSRKAELKQLQKQVSQHQKQQKQFTQDIATLESRKQQLEADYRILQTQVQELDKQKAALPQASVTEFQEDIFNILPDEWQEWLKFATQLNETEQTALKAILERDEAALKKIADKKSTMPQVLIDAINNQALEKFGDTLFVSGGGLTIPEVHEEYLPIFLEPIEIYFKDLLELKNQHNVSQSSRLPQSRY